MGEKCPFGKPNLLIGNHFAWELFEKVSGQVITTGMGDILGIKFEAISFLFEIYDIIDGEEKFELFEKITTIDMVRMQMRSDEMRAKKQSEAAKAKNKTVKQV